MASRIKSPNTFLDRLSAGTQYFQPYSFEPSEEDKKSEEFLLKAAGERAPSTLSMYNSHHALVSQMYDQLTSEDTLNHYAETPEGMVKWKNMMADLEDRINVYEGIYDATYGDPLKANGNGFTFADEEFRSNSTDGNPSKFFPGYDVAEEFDPAATLMEIDRKDAVSNVTLNLETGQFDFDANIAQGQGWFDLSQSLQNTSIFDYRGFRTQTSFNDPLAYSEMGDLYRRYNENEESVFKNHFENILSTDINKQRDAAAYYIEQIIAEGDDPGFESVSELMSAASSGDATATSFLDSAYDSFYGAVKEEMDNRKKIKEEEEEREWIKQKRRNKQKEEEEEEIKMPTSYPDVFDYNDSEVKGTSYDVSGKKIKIRNIEEEVDLRAIIRAEDGELYARIEQEGLLINIPLLGNNLNGDEILSKLEEKYSPKVVLNIIRGGAVNEGGGLDPASDEFSDNSTQPFNPLDRVDGSNEGPGIPFRPGYGPDEDDENTLNPAVDN